MYCGLLATKNKATIETPVQLFNYIEIERFKRFESMQRIDLSHPAVMIGPNNCGKTSVLQALALWSMGLKTWFSARRDSSASERTAVRLNRLSIVSVPVQRTRLFWHNARVREGQQPIHMNISVGLEFEGRERKLTMRFRSSSDELAYCEPVPEDDEAGLDFEFLKHAAMINVELLYSMSGIETEEPIIQPGRIDVLLGLGQTAQVLRNLCLMVWREHRDDWVEIQEHMRRLFGVDLLEPKEDPARGTVELTYRQSDVKVDLDISMAGRGFLQLLLLFSYLYSHKKSVILIDEPDAHLEILRQRQVYVLLRDLAQKNGSQVVLATHSEVILNESLDTNLTLILEGEAMDLATVDQIKSTLRHFGAEHYVRAKQSSHVLYLEGSTDLDMLRGFAQATEHPVAEKLEKLHELNIYYIRDNDPGVEQSIDHELSRVEGGYGHSPKKHFFGLRGMIPNLAGLAIRDVDSSQKTENEAGGLRELFWKRYEAENYFITPELLMHYAKENLQDLELFDGFSQQIEKTIKELLLKRVFDGSDDDLAAYWSADTQQKNLIWRTATERLKLSDFAEEFFRQIAARTGTSMLLKKARLFELIGHKSMVELNGEVREKLDALQELLQPKQEV